MHRVPIVVDHNSDACGQRHEKHQPKHSDAARMNKIVAQRLQTRRRIDWSKGVSKEAWCERIGFTGQVGTNGIARPSSVIHIAHRIYKVHFGTTKRGARMKIEKRKLFVGYTRFEKSFFVHFFFHFLQKAGVSTLRELAPPS